MLTVVLTKIGYMGWQIAPPLLNFTGISGHTASAATLYLSLAMLASRRASRAHRILVVGATFCVVLAIAYSRLAIKVHSTSEVITGLLIGIIAALLFARGVVQPALSSRPLAGKFVMALLVMVVVLASGGKPAPTQDLLTKIAMTLADRPAAYGRTQPL